MLPRESSFTGAPSNAIPYVMLTNGSHDSGSNFTAVGSGTDHGGGVFPRKRVILPLMACRESTLLNNCIQSLLFLPGCESVLLGQPEQKAKDLTSSSSSLSVAASSVATSTLGTHQLGTNREDKDETEDDDAPLGGSGAVCEGCVCRNNSSSNNNNNNNNASHINNSDNTDNSNSNHVDSNGIDHSHNHDNNLMHNARQVSGRGSTSSAGSDSHIHTAHSGAEQAPVMDNDGMASALHRAEEDAALSFPRRSASSATTMEAVMSLEQQQQQMQYKHQHHNTRQNLTLSARHFSPIPPHFPGTTPSSPRATYHAYSPVAAQSAPHLIANDQATDHQAGPGIRETAPLPHQVRHNPYFLPTTTATEEENTAMPADERSPHESNHSPAPVGTEEFGPSHNRHNHDSGSNSMHDIDESHAGGTPEHTDAAFRVPQPARSTRPGDTYNQGDDSSMANEEASRCTAESGYIMNPRNRSRTYNPVKKSEDAQEEAGAAPASRSEPASCPARTVTDFNTDNFFAPSAMELASRATALSPNRGGIRLHWNQQVCTTGSTLYRNFVEHAIAWMKTSQVATTTTASTLVPDTLTSTGAVGYNWASVCPSTQSASMPVLSSDTTNRAMRTDDATLRHRGGPPSALSMDEVLRLEVARGQTDLAQSRYRSVWGSSWRDSGKAATTGSVGAIEEDERARLAVPGGASHAHLFSSGCRLENSRPVLSTSMTPGAAAFAQVSSVEDEYECWTSNSCDKMPVFPLPQLSGSVLTMLAENMVVRSSIDMNAQTDVNPCRALGSPLDLWSLSSRAQHEKFITAVQLMTGASYLQM